MQAGGVWLGQIAPEGMGVPTRKTGRNALKETVRENLHMWYDHVKKSKSPGMKTFMRTIKEREEDLINYYETFVTNASAESLNSGIKGFRAELHGISNLPFFFYRVCKIYG